MNGMLGPFADLDAVPWVGQPQPPEWKVSRWNVGPFVQGDHIGVVARDRQEHMDAKLEFDRRVFSIDGIKR